MPSGAWDLTALLNSADAHAPLPERNLWLVRLLEWLRHGEEVEGDATPKPVLRLKHLLNVLDRHPAHREQVGAALIEFWRAGDVAALFADVGFSSGRHLTGELAARMRLRWLPITTETTDLALLFNLLFEAKDSRWIGDIDDDTLQRIVALLRSSGADGDADVNADHADVAQRAATTALWRQPLLDAMRAVASHIHASGLSAHLQQRMTASLLADRPFAQLPQALDRVIVLLEDDNDAQARIQATYLRALLDRCHAAADSVHEHLEEYGVSVNVVFEVDQLHGRVHRLDALLNCALSPDPARELATQLAKLVALTEERRSLRALFSRHYSLLARKVTERNAETGEHYITRNATEFLAMLRKAAGGGVVLAVTTFVKFAILALGLGAFWSGFWAGVNYASSFLVIHLLHFTVATKQPAMTAPAMAAKLADVSDDAKLSDFVDEVAHLVRSQMAGIVGNLALVAPLVFGAQTIAQLALGRPLVGPVTSQHVLDSLTLLGPTALYAAFTGILLFASSLIAGWVENFFVYYQLDSALAWNPRILNRLGAERARRWSVWWRANVSGVAANLSLGMMLGVMPALLSFFGPPIEVRHVTLSTGQLVAAATALGWPVLHAAALWWCVAGIAITGWLNLTVSFGLAMGLALRSRGITVRDRRRIYGAVWRRMWRHPRSFVWPP